LVLFYAVVVDIQYNLVADVAGVGVVVEVNPGVLLDVLRPDTAASTSVGFLFPELVRMAVDDGYHSLVENQVPGLRLVECNCKRRHLYNCRRRRLARKTLTEVVVIVSQLVRRLRLLEGE
jgi:hypothetical protein